MVPPALHTRLNKKKIIEIGASMRKLRDELSNLLLSKCVKNNPFSTFL